jgi:hypothetical protein
LARAKILRGKTEERRGEREEPRPHRTNGLKSKGLGFTTDDMIIVALSVSSATGSEQPLEVLGQCQM